MAEEFEYKCPSCSADFDMENVDLKKRIGYCIYCRGWRPIPKKHSNNSAELDASLNEAVSLFKAGNFPSARRCAETVIALSKKNAVATYIVSFCDAFTESFKDTKKYEDYFRRQFPDFILEFEEEELLKQLLIATRTRSADFECDILKKFCEYDDPDELASFVDKFCPTTIAKRTDVGWMNEEMVETYKDISHKCSVPATWLALYNSMLKNPDSPLSDGSFYLKTKAERIYDEFILKIGEIFDSISDTANKEKFTGAFAKVQKVYQAKLGNS